MDPKAKNVVGSKRSRRGEASRSSNLEPVRKFGEKVIERYGWEWFECQREPKYIGNEYVNEVRLQSQFLVIYRIVLELGLRFIFDHPGDCNLSLVREFYANWLIEIKYKIVPIRGKDVKFNATILNEFLGTPNCDSDYFNTLKDKPPYRDIRHTLCGVESTARWESSKDIGRHYTFHFANFNKVARVWLKIVCSVLLPAKHLTDVTRDSVVLVYMLMKGMPINGIEEEVVDLTIAFQRQARDDCVMERMFGMAELQLWIGGRPITDEEMENLADRYPLIESAASLCRTGPAFLEPMDDDETTANEVMDGAEDDAGDEEANALMVFNGGDNEA
ncbi:hypothetical protein KY290_010426 [Solanum tuberosum]|uniref:Putative plant transposon protein domain-containing protein n=1 Tax=Solanum tuberosum TaxID=4113 RepID=A0ABQ7VXR8_SOLTU|nr:hypothetical protein KY284_010336 [Solanum tuberosum]KAH0773289.1 hypothetical protein KY290_010426 [Solanum tuberosum]